MSPDTSTSQQEQMREVRARAVQHSFALAAQELSDLPAERQVELLEELPTEQAVEVFRFLDAAYQRLALERLTHARAQRLVEMLDPDDRARLVEGMPLQLARSLLAGLSPAERRMTSELLDFPPESAGRHMTREFLALECGWSVARALQEVRARARAVETIYVLPVLGEDERLLGVVHLRDLVLADASALVDDLIDPGIGAIHFAEDRERAARLIQTTDALAAPVVDAQGRLLGLVTVDDAMDILDHEAGEDFALAGGASEPLNRPYFSVSILHLARTRAVWLLVLAVAATLTVNVLAAFEDTLESVVALALFIPLLIGTGGNAGAQTATTLVRAMSMGEASARNLPRVLSREAMVGMLLGSVLAAVSLLPVWLFAGQDIALIVALTLIAICAWASTIGALVPLVAHRLGVDPAVASAPFITTLIDATGLLIYFLIARALL